MWFYQDGFRHNFAGVDFLCFQIDEFIALSESALNKTTVVYMDISVNRQRIYRQNKTTNRNKTSAMRLRTRRVGPRSPSISFLGEVFRGGRNIRCIRVSLHRCGRASQPARATPTQPPALNGTENE